MSMKEQGVDRIGAAIEENIQQACHLGRLTICGDRRCWRRSSLSFLLDMEPGGRHIAASGSRKVAGFGPPITP